MTEEMTRHGPIIGTRSQSLSRRSMPSTAGQGRSRQRQISETHLRIILLDPSDARDLG